MLGVSIFIDGLDGVTYFPLRVFGTLLLVESLITLSIASSGVGAQKAVLYFKGAIFCSVSILILSNRAYSNLLLAIVFGFAFFVIGLFIISSAWVVRYPHWKNAMLGGIAQIIFALFMFSPYPTHYKATVPVFLGTLMLISGINTARLALRARQISEGASIFDLLAPSNIQNDLTKHQVSLTSDSSNADFIGPLTVHI